jgi:hypothetical protein
LGVTSAHSAKIEPGFAERNTRKSSKQGIFGENCWKILCAEFHKYSGNHVAHLSGTNRSAPA